MPVSEYHRIGVAMCVRTRYTENEDQKVMRKLNGITMETIYERRAT